MMPTNQKRLRTTGFTLIELLVVISIIAMLLSILMPALGVAKKHAQRIVCLSNLRQLVIATTTYSLDNNDKVFLYPNTGNSNAYKYAWYHQISRYIGDKELDETTLVQDAEVPWLLCPTAKKVDEGAVLPFGEPEDRAGTATSAWRYLGGKGSYGLNTWFQPELGREILWGPANSVMYPFFFNKLYEADSRTILFCDSTWPGGLLLGKEYENVGGEPDYERQNGWSLPGGAADGMWTGLGRICIDRHLKAINVAFADGRAETVKLRDLFTLNWNTLSQDYKDFDPIFGNP